MSRSAGITVANLASYTEPDLPELNSSVVREILAVAQDTTVAIFKDTSWSSFHSMECVASIQGGSAAGVATQAQLDEYEHHWRSAHPFGNCIDSAHLAIEQLKIAYERHPNPRIQKHSQSFQLWAAYTDYKGDGAKEPWHCVALMTDKQYAIVVDLSYHMRAFLIGAGTTFYAIPSVNFRNLVEQSVYRYTFEDGEARLSIHTVYDGEPADDLSIFSPIQYRDAIEQIVFRDASRVGQSRVDHEGDKDVPRPMYIVASSIVSTRPSELPCIEVTGGFLANTCRFSINYMLRSILIQLPQADFRSICPDPDMTVVLERKDLIYSQAGKAVTTLILEFKKTQVNILADVCYLSQVVKQFGLPQVEFYSIVRSIALRSKFPKRVGNRAQWLLTEMNKRIEELSLDD
jgi:hypothetical protein